MKKFVCLISVFVLAIGINSCREEIIDVTEDSGQFSVKEAKAWLDSQYPEILSLKSGIERTAQKQYKAQWECAVTSENNEVEVVETYIASSGRFGFASNESFDEWQASGELGYISSVTKLVVLKQKESEEIISFLLTFVGDKDYLDMNCFELWENKYLKKADNYNGLVLFHSLEGEFVNGWRYTDGEVTHSLELNGKADVSLELKSAMVCETYTYVAYTDNCTDWWSVALIDGAPDWEHANYMHSDCDITPSDISITECMVVNNNNNGGGPSGGYNPPSGDPDPLPCDCNICPRCGGCMGEVLKSGSTNCPMCSCDCDFAISVGIECDALLSFEQDYKTNMSETEKELYDNMTRVQQLSYLSNAQFASWAAEGKYPDELWNGKGDALRHALWNAFNVIDLGINLATLLTTAHEDKDSSYSYSYKETEMDLFNNEVGREIANEWQQNPIGSLEEAIYEAFYEGEFRYLNNLLSSGAATNNSQLIPTNQ